MSERLETWSMREGEKMGVTKSTWALVLAIIAVSWLGSAILLSGATSLGERGPCETSSQVVSIAGGLTTHLYVPTEGTCNAGIAAPYPAVVFAHGFGMFGLSNGAQDNAGNGEHLASWGYVVALPELSDEFEARLAEMQEVLSYLETQTEMDGSALYQQVDTQRLAVAGHSLGGATALALASRDARARAVVALDPVYHTGGFGGQGDALWNPEVEAPHIVAPTVILGAPASSCNADADYVDIYPWVGAMHKASYALVGGSHCDFNDPGNRFCGLICGPADPARTDLSQKYMTAWFNYYLYLRADDYTYLYGSDSDTDVGLERIERRVDTAPRGLTATGTIGAIYLEWTPYGHPIVAGYNVYRRSSGASYDETPYAQVAWTGTYTDTNVVSGQIYSYTVRSRDVDGNEHEPADEVSAVAHDSPTPPRFLYLPLVRRSDEQGQ